MSGSGDSSTVFPVSLAGRMCVLARVREYTELNQSSKPRECNILRCWKYGVVVVAAG